MSTPTQKQLDFLKNLADERPNKIAELPPKWILRLKSALQGELDAKATSNAIEFLKGVEPDIVYPTPTVGFYRLNGDIYEVRLNVTKSGVYTMRRTLGETILPKGGDYSPGAIFQIAKNPDRLSEDEAKPFVRIPRAKPRPRVRVNA